MSVEHAYEHITWSADGGVAEIAINRPQVLNACHPPTCAELGAALDRFEADDSLSVAIITGCGDRAFSAGFDLQYAEEHPELYGTTSFGDEVVRRTNRRKPLIAAVNGVALGFGFEMALACDIIVATAKARFGLPEVKVGLAAMAGGVVRLTREIGPKLALGYSLTGDLIPAAEGYRLGFVNEVTEGSALDCARGWAAKIAKNAPLALIATREMAYLSRDLPTLDEALDPARYPAVIAVAQSEDAHEGRRAFIARREPQWKNR